MRFRVARLPVGKHVAGKRYLDMKTVEKLFSEPIVIEEKLDGRQETKVFEIEDGKSLVLCGEMLKHTHSIFYDRLPGWFVVWDVYDQTASKFVDYDTKAMLSRRYNFPIPPLIVRGKMTLDAALKFLNRKSGFGSQTQEGIVIKSMASQLRGKVVREEFIAGIELQGHWTRRHGLLKNNRLAPR